MKKRKNERDGKKKKKNQRDGSMKRPQQDLIGFEDGSMWPQAKDCGWSLESGISKKTYIIS